MGEKPPTLDQPLDAPQAEVGIIGGTGLYNIEGLSELKEVSLETPFGSPSDAYLLGELDGRRVAFLSRHGRGHFFLPSEVNYRANIFGFKLLGVKRIISVNSVGSLQENIHPRHIVLPDQFFDRSRRPNTFFGQGIVAHISFAQPTCPDLNNHLYTLTHSMGLPVHRGGTYLCIEGPAFSTKAESHVYRQWGCHIIGMTSATEARLAREAEICYASLSFVTDYDVWHEEEEAVSVELILDNLHHNISQAKSLIKKAIQNIPSQPDRGKCPCPRALENTIVTQPSLIPEETKNNLWPLIGKYLG